MRRQRTLKGAFDFSGGGIALGLRFKWWWRAGKCFLIHGVTWVFAVTVTEEMTNLMANYGL